MLRYCETGIIRSMVTFELSDFGWQREWNSQFAILFLFVLVVLSRWSDWLDCCNADLRLGLLLSNRGCLEQCRVEFCIVREVVWLIIVGSKCWRERNICVSVILRCKIEVFIFRSELGLYLPEIY